MLAEISTINACRRCSNFLLLDLAAFCEQIIGYLFSEGNELIRQLFCQIVHVAYSTSPDTQSREAYANVVVHAYLRKKVSGPCAGIHDCNSAEVHLPNDGARLRKGIVHDHVQQGFQECACVIKGVQGQEESKSTGNRSL